MTNDEKKQYLSGYLYSIRKVERLGEQIAELRSQKMFPSVNYDGMPGGSGISDLSGYAARLDILIRRLEEEKANAVYQYQEIHDQIARMPDGAEKEILERRYLMNQPWEKIAVSMHYTFRWVTKLHGRALNKFEIVETGPTKTHETMVI